MCGSPSVSPQKPPANLTSPPYTAMDVNLDDLPLLWLDTKFFQGTTKQCLPLAEAKKIVNDPNWKLSNWHNLANMKRSFANLHIFPLLKSSLVILQTMKPQLLSCWSSATCPLKSFYGRISWSAKLKICPLPIPPKVLSPCLSIQINRTHYKSLLIKDKKAAPFSLPLIWWLPHRYVWSFHLSYVGQSFVMSHQECLYPLDSPASRVFLIQLDSLEVDRTLILSWSLISLSRLTSLYNIHHYSKTTPSGRVHHHGVWLVLVRKAPESFIKLLFFKARWFSVVSIDPLCQWCQNTSLYCIKNWEMPVLVGHPCLVGWTTPDIMCWLDQFEMWRPHWWARDNLLWFLSLVCQEFLLHQSQQWCLGLVGLTCQSFCGY